MIRASKYLDISTCVLTVSSVIIKELLEIRTIPLDELSELVRVRLSRSAYFNFLPALNFLFLIGVLDYEEQTDTINLTTSIQQK